MKVRFSSLQNTGYKITIEPERIQYFPGGASTHIQGNAAVFRNGSLDLDSDKDADLGLIKALRNNKVYGIDYRHIPESEVRIIDGRKATLEGLDIDTIIEMAEEARKKPKVATPAVVEPIEAAPDPAPVVVAESSNGKEEAPKRRGRPRKEITPEPEVKRGPQVLTGPTTSADMMVAPDSKYVR